MTARTSKGYVLPLGNTLVELFCEHVDADRGNCPERATDERAIDGRVWLMCADHAKPGSAK